MNPLWRKLEYCKYYSPILIFTVVSGTFWKEAPALSANIRLGPVCLLAKNASLLLKDVNLLEKFYSIGPRA